MRLSTQTARPQIALNERSSVRPNSEVARWGTVLLAKPAITKSPDRAGDGTATDPLRVVNIPPPGHEDGIATVGERFVRLAEHVWGSFASMVAHRQYAWPKNLLSGKISFTSSARGIQPDFVVGFPPCGRPLARHSGDRRFGNAIVPNSSSISFVSYHPLQIGIDSYLVAVG